MLQKIVEHSIFKNPKITGVELFVQDVDTKANTVLVSKKGNKISFSDQKELDCSAENLHEFLDKKYQSL